MLKDCLWETTSFVPFNLFSDLVLPFVIRDVDPQRDRGEDRLHRRGCLPYSLCTGSLSEACIVRV